MTTGASNADRRLAWERAFVAATIAAFVFTPFLRRLSEWRGAFASIDILSPLPLVMLLVVAFFAYRRRDAIQRTAYPLLAAIWVVAFGYAAVVGFVQRAGLTAVYGAAIYVLPLAVGAWMIGSGLPARTLARQFATFLLVLAGASGAYGIFQFVVAPPWDTAWLQNVNAGSFGLPIPFGIRVFSTMNGPAIFADFVSCALILNLSTISLRRWWTAPALLLSLVALLLTLVRTAWLELLLAMIVVAVLSPDRGRAVVRVAAMLALCVVGIGIFFVAVPNDEFRETLSTRFQTFSQLADDGSARDRGESAGNGLAAALAHPQGVGLGVAGIAAKLTSSDILIFNYNPDPAIDEGFVTRLYEMGVFGFAGFIGALVVGLFLSFAAYGACIRSRDDELSSMVANCIAFQIAIIGGLLAGDNLQGAIGTVYFCCVALPLAAGLESRAKIGARLATLIHRTA